MPSLIIDTDPGVDDAFAIAVAARSREADLLALTTVFGNVELVTTTRNALRILALCGRHDVPVAAGAGRPLVYPAPWRAGPVHGGDGLSGHADALPEPTHPHATVGAVELMARLLADAKEPVTIAAIGPLTNIALLLAVHPELGAAIERVVVMGGALTAGNTTAGAEFNIFSDPESARRVLAEETVPVTLVPLDVTHGAAVDDTWLARLAGSGPLGTTLDALTPTYRAHYRVVLGREALVLHDAVAVAEALRPGLLRTEAMPVDVECSLGPARGATVVDHRPPALREVPSGPRPVDVAIGADVEELHRYLLSTLEGS